MTVGRSVTLLCGLLASGAVIVGATGPAVVGGAVQLTAISARADRTGATVVIEATGPAPYVATRPDPLTLFVDFRGVGTDTVANRFSANASSPVAAVRVEAAELLGEPVSRVHISLAQEVGYRVRSERNRVVVEFDPVKVKPRAAQSAAARPDPMAALERGSKPVEPTALLQGRERPGAQAAQAATTQAPPVASVGCVRPMGGKSFTGNPVSLDFQGADLRAVLRTFAEISGLNLVIDPDVKGSVDVTLREVPWDQALDVILSANKLGYCVDGTIVRIASVEVFTDEDKRVAQAADARVAAAQLETLPQKLSYAKGEDLATLLKTAKILSARGDAYVDARTNTLIVRDLPEQIPQISSLIATLDTAQPQVEIEARIVQTKKTFARAIGVQWGFMGKVDPTLGNTTNLAFPNNGSLGGRSGTSQGVTPPANGVAPAVNLGVPGAATALGLALGSINGAFNLDVALTAAEKSGNVRLLSTPRVSTQNNMEAEIAQGVQIPYQTTSNNTVTTQFKDAALTLKVTPQITAANTVIMRIAVDNGSVGDIVPGGVSINTQRASTTVQVDNGQTTVIGGIYFTQQVKANDKVPGIGNVPLLKWLFNRDALDDQSTELLIFLTPHIIK